MYRELHEGTAHGPLCYFPEFLGGLASTLSVCSQNHEDGALLALMAFAGFKTREVVEICGGNGSENNGAYFVHNHGFRGVFFDGDAENSKACAQHFAMRGVPSTAAPGDDSSSRADDADRPAARCVNGWIDAEKVGGLVADGFAAMNVPTPEATPPNRRDVDLLSLDIDGIDLYLLQPILETVNPRVIVVEYQDIVGPDRALTVPYAADFAAKWIDGNPDFAGASLPAFVRVLSRWGYHFVGCEALGFNGFFVRHDVIREGHEAGRGSVRVVTPRESGCFDKGKVREGMQNRWPNVEAEPWVEVNDAWLEKHAPGPGGDASRRSRNGGRVSRA